LDITCIFTDLAGFTSLMENADPAQVLPVLNKYLENMCAIVRVHGGTLDKIVGDALHVFFGAPLKMQDHPAKAIECALQMDIYARKFEASDEARTVAFGGTRIGVHSGLAVVGNFGGETFFDYTAHGDTVNTTARMEGANKYLGTRLCVSSETARRCPGVSFRPIGSLMLKGKTQLIEAFEPIAKDATRGIAEYMAAFDLMVAGDDDAKEAFAQLTQNYPDDPLAAFHATRLVRGNISSLIESRRR
jgi:adenylate cyclase